MCPKKRPQRNRLVAGPSPHVRDHVHLDWNGTFLKLPETGWKMIDPKAKLLAVLDTAEKYRGLAIRAKDRGERETYERIVELYVEIAEELERLIDGRS